jgi:D-2-hydroxyacid dehydrogenase (NADP+)
MLHISIWLNLPVVISWVFSIEHKKKLEKALPDCEISLYDDSESFKANLETTDIALVWVFKQEWLNRAPKLKWIATPSAGKDWFNIDLPKEINITYGGFHGKIIAETVLGAMLGFSRGLWFACQNKGKYIWPRKEIEPYCNSLRGSNLAILGFGKIGLWIAKLAKPFGVKIIGIKRTLIEPPDFFDKNDKIISIEHLDSILPEVDHLVLALPSHESTNNIIDERRLNLLGNNTFIYNIGRGNSIDENALANALMRGKIKGAYLDVFKKEPLDKKSPLRQCPNLIITPHTSAIAPNFFDYFIEEFISKYHEWIKSNIQS